MSNRTKLFKQIVERLNESGMFLNTHQGKHMRFRVYVTVLSTDGETLIKMVRSQLSDIIADDRAVEIYITSNPLIVCVAIN